MDGLLGTRTRWIPQDQDYQVKITGMVQKTKTQSTLKIETLKSEKASSTRLLSGSGESYAGGASGVIKKKKRENTTGLIYRRYHLTPGKPDQVTDTVEAEEEEDDEEEEPQSHYPHDCNAWRTTT